MEEPSGSTGMRAPQGSRRALGALVLRYIALAIALSWACWAAAMGLIACEGVPGARVGAGALQVAGTLCPLFAAYALFPRIKACGLVPAEHVRRAGARDDENDDRRAGFWRFAFGGTARWGAWGLFALYAVWRWAMFYLAFGFPATPGVALANFASQLPLLFLGGGFEEVGWRGCLQPALAALVAPAGSGKSLCIAGALVAPVATGAVWAAWHLPLFAMPGAFQNGMAFAPFLGVAVALSFSLGAVYGQTRSLLAPIGGHAWYNAMLVAMPRFGMLPLVLFCVEALAGALAGVCAAYGFFMGGHGDKGVKNTRS